MTTSAREQSARLAALLRDERAALADFLVALAAFDEARRWSELGYTSLFWFLHRELGLSKGAAFFRKTGAELLRKFPAVLEPLTDGRLCLSSVPELAKVLTAENLDEVLPRFFHLSKHEAKEVTAELQPEPAPPLREVVTTVRAPALELPAGIAPALAPEVPLLLPTTRGFPENLVRANSGVPGVASAPTAPSAPPAPATAVLEIEPLTGELRRLHLTVPKRLLEKLDAARDALSHSHPGADTAEILEAALDLVLDRAAKRRGLVKKPRKVAPVPERTAGGEVVAPAPQPAPGQSRSRYVPAAVSRAVWERDRGCCAWPLENGGVCGSTLRVEIDHIDGFARGAGSTPDDLRLLCRVHQDVSARRMYGDDLMDAYTRGPRGGGCAEPVAAWAA